jgi:hypothetical protein
MHDSPASGTRYEIVIEGQIDRGWSEWFEGLAITPAADATTRLSGSLADQTALFGVLKKLHHLGLPLISVRRLAAPERTSDDDT